MHDTPRIRPPEPRKRPRFRGRALVLTGCLGLHFLAACFAPQRVPAPAGTTSQAQESKRKESPLSPPRRIAFGSCQTAEAPIPILRTIARERPDFFVYLGDNVYGDAENDPQLSKLRREYERLRKHEDFVTLRRAVPLFATWDDHDFGRNDGGGDFPGKFLAKSLFEAFWGTSERTGSRDGVYDVWEFGPSKARIQLILLDTRFARSPLERAVPENPRGPYQESSARDQQMLSEAEWSWLEKTLRVPADLRIVASSIQVLATGHGYESWNKLPRERERLLRTLHARAPSALVLISGDRHLGGIYEDRIASPETLVEVTSSSLNRSFVTTTDEEGENQLGPLFGPPNYGTLLVDWEERVVRLQLKDGNGTVVREHPHPLEPPSLP